MPGARAVAGGPRQPWLPRPPSPRGAPGPRSPRARPARLRRAGRCGRAMDPTLDRDTRRRARADSGIDPVDHQSDRKDRDSWRRPAGSGQETRPGAPRARSRCGRFRAARAAPRARCDRIRAVRRGTAPRDAQARSRRDAAARHRRRAPRRTPCDAARETAGAASPPGGIRAARASGSPPTRSPRPRRDRATVPAVAAPACSCRCPADRSAAGCARPRRRSPVHGGRRPVRARPPGPARDRAATRQRVSMVPAPVRAPVPRCPIA